MHVNALRVYIFDKSVLFFLSLFFSFSLSLSLSDKINFNFE